MYDRCRYSTTTTTTAGTLETETYIGAEELAVAHLDILYATTHLAANNETTVPLEYGTAVYDVHSRKECLAFFRQHPYRS